MGTSPLLKMQCRVTGVAGGPYYLTGYFKAEDGTAQASQDAWWNFITSSVAANELNGVTYTIDPAVPIVFPVTGEITGTESTTGKTVTGSNSATVAPSQAQYVYNLRTGVYTSGREVRGRFHRPLVYQSDVVVTNAQTAGSLTSLAISGNNTRAANLITAAAGRWVVYSRKNASWEVITSATVRPILGTLRSRGAISG